ncbi:hypothetical protein [Bacillus sp. 123MFChir2]|uniref:hypothetical protein n=1 Tax=Bacillus sp. 123MFChir2 TaxID=1169144 RepID=UPI0003798900|nr:hypothetical protein [Bacillus sp. 123MFChir2]
MGNYLTTINHDLQGLKKIMLGSHSSPNFNSAPIFSLFRDICITLYETNKVLKEDGLIGSDLPNIEVIKEIRHKVKTNQGFKNREIFNKLLDGHKSVFGNDIDNLGFYLDNDILASTTLFPTFVFADTPLFNIFDKNTILNFTSIISSLVQEILNKINQPINLDSKPLKNLDEKEYILKDTWDQRFFTKDITYNVFLTRLLLIQNELTTCIWLENHLDYNSSKLNFDKYILLRLTSTKLFETMRNLLDIKKILGQHWNNFNLNTLDYLLGEYENTLKDEMKTLRDMLHYNNKGINFYDYIQKQTRTDTEYLDKLIKIIFNDYIYKIRNTISITINIQSYKTMSDFEKISRRLKSYSYRN